MGDQLYLERFVWFDNEARRDRFPNASKLAVKFEITTKTAQRSIDYFRDRLQAPLAYRMARRLRRSQEEREALLVALARARGCECALVGRPAAERPRPCPG